MKQIRLLKDKFVLPNLLLQQDDYDSDATDDQQYDNDGGEVIVDMTVPNNGNLLAKKVNRNGQLSVAMRTLMYQRHAMWVKFPLKNLPVMSEQAQGWQKCRMNEWRYNI